MYIKRMGKRLVAVQDGRSKSKVPIIIITEQVFTLPSASSKTASTGLRHAGKRTWRVLPVVGGPDVILYTPSHWHLYCHQPVHREQDPVTYYEPVHP